MYEYIMQAARFRHGGVFEAEAGAINFGPYPNNCGDMHINLFFKSRGQAQLFREDLQKLAGLHKLLAGDQIVMEPETQARARPGPHAVFFVSGPPGHYDGFPGSVQRSGFATR